MEDLLKHAVLVTIWLLALITVTHTACPPNTAQYLDRCLWPNEALQNMVNAFKPITCQIQNGSATLQGRVAEPDVPEMALFIAAIATFNYEMRIGTQRINGKFVWMSDNRPVTWANWLPGQPHSSDMSIAIRTDTYWDGRQVSTTRRTLCEIVIPVNGCPTRWLPRFRFVLNGGNKRNVGSKSIFACLYQCQQDPACLSVDYRFDQNDDICYLVDANEKQFPVTSNTKFIHFDYFCKEGLEELVKGPGVAFDGYRPISNYPATAGFLFYAPRSGFVSWESTHRAWFKVEFNRQVEVHAILMLGVRRKSPYWDSGYTSNLYLLYSEEGKVWKYYRNDDDTPYLITANAHHNVISGHYLRKPIEAKGFILNLKAYSILKCMRFGAIGRYITSLDDKWYNPVGIEDEYLMDSQMTSNDYYVLYTHNNYSPWSGRLNHDFVLYSSEAAFWTSALASNVKEFWQVDLLVTHHVTAIASQGRHNFDQWTTSYEISLSNDTFTWNYVNNTSGSRKRYTASFERFFAIGNNINQVGRYVRFHPRSYYNRDSSRFEVYGWPQECPVVDQDGQIEPSASCSCSGRKGWSFCPAVGSQEGVITMNHLYLATHIIISIPTGLNWTSTSLQISLGTQAGLHAINSTQYVVASETPGAGFNSKVLKLRRVWRVSRVKLKVDGTEWSSGGCLSFWMKACLAEYCPPSFFLYGKKCIWPVNAHIVPSKPKNLEVCERVVWDKSAYLASIDDAEEHGAIAVTTYRHVFGASYIGLIRNASNIYSWRDGSKSDYTGWDLSQPGTNTAYSMTAHHHTLYSWYDYLPTAKFNYVCSTPAVNTNNVTTWKWFMALNYGLQGAAKVKLEGLSLVDCMEACVKHPNFKCSAVSAGHRTRTCYLFDSNRTTKGVTFTTSSFSSSDYAERYFNVCDNALIWGPNGVGGDYVYASSYTGTRYPRNAKLGNQFGHFRLGTSLVTGNYFQVDLRRVVKINRMSVQGSSRGPVGESYYCNNMVVLTSNDSIYWSYRVNEDKTRQVFVRRIDFRLPTVFFFRPYLYARFFRIQCSSGTAAGRIELYGCDIGMQYDLGCAVELISYGYYSSKGPLLAVNGESANAWQTVNRIHLVTLNLTDTSCRINSTHVYNINNLNEAQQFSDFLKALPNGTVIAATTARVIRGGLLNYKDTLRNMFNMDVSPVRLGSSFQFIAKVGDPSFTRFKLGDVNVGLSHLAVKLRPFPQDSDVNLAHLGITTGHISWDQLSYIRNNAHIAWISSQAKLFVGGSNANQVHPAWLTTYFTGQWFQVDLYILHEIRGIITQGSGHNSYYIKTISIGVSNDTYKWETIKSKATGKVEVYPTNYERFFPIFTAIEPHAIARAVRVYPKSVNSHSAIRLELVGKPYDYPAFNLQGMGAILTSSGNNGECILLPSCPSGLCSAPPANVWVQANFKFLYHVTKFAFNANQTTDVTLKEIKYSSSPDMKYRVVETNRTYWTVNEGTKEMILAPHIKAWFVHLTFSWTSDSCLSVSIHGTKATACPPGMTQDGDRCFYIHEMELHYDLLRTMCNEIDWVERATVPITKTYEDIQQYYKFARSRGTAEHWAGLRKRTDNKWYWENGELATDVKWYDGVTNECAGIEYGFVRDESCTTRRFGGCSMKAAVAEDEKFVPWWIGRPSICIGGFSTAYSPMPHILLCLPYCEHALGSEVLSVDVQRGNDGRCHCNTVNSTTQSVSSCPSDYTFYEKFYRSFREWDSLLLDKVNLTKPKFTSKTASTSQWSVEQAFLNTEPTTGKLGCWISTRYWDIEEWLQVELVQVVKFQDFIVQGCGKYNSYYVKTFSLAYRNSTVPGWTVIRKDDGKNLKVFTANEERYLHQTVHLLQPIVAQVVRWIIRSVNSVYSALRVDIRGTIINERPLPLFPEHGPLGMESKKIGDNQLKASSYRVTSAGVHCIPRTARLNEPKTAPWCSTWVPRPNTASGHWVQVSFPVEYDIHGVHMQNGQSASGFSYHYSVSYSQDDINWKFIVDENNQTKKFQGVCKQYYEYGEFSHIIPPVRTKLIRLTPENYQTHHSLKFELYGKVSEFQSDILLSGAQGNMELKTSTSGTSCEDDNIDVPLYKSTFNCSMWCFSQNTKQTINLNLPKHHLLSSITVTERTASVISQYKINISSDGKIFKDLPSSVVSQTMNQSVIHETSYRLQLGTIIKSLKLEVTPQSSSLTCVRLSAKGVIAPGCPPGYAQYGTRCIRFIYHVNYPETARQWCQEEGNTWLGEGTLAKADNVYIKNFLSHVVVNTNGLRVYSGAILKSGTWEWMDGSPMTWSVWTSTGTSSQIYGTFTTEAKLQPSIKWYRPYTCQIKAADKDNDVSWIHLGSQIINVPWFHTIPRYNTTECLRACLVGLVEGCSSVWHQKRTQTCVLTRATRAAGGLVLTTLPTTNTSGGDYWEIYRGGSCDTPLLLRKVIQFTLTVSSTYSAQFSDDQLLYGDKPAAGKAGYWVPSASDSSPSIEVRFTTPVTLGRMVIVGNENSAVPQYVKTFKLSYTMDNTKWFYITDALSLTETIQANTDPKVPTTVLFPGLPLGKTFRITPLTWQGIAAAQIELFGCAEKETITCVHTPKPELSIPGSPTVTLGCLESWTVIMRRCSSDFNFHRSWNEYTKGFGTLPCDYYMGNSAIFFFTKNRWYYMRFDIYGIDGHFYSAEFDKFQLADETKRFNLSIGSYLSGSAGVGAMSSYKQKQFSTPDNDNSGYNCSDSHTGGWWYDSSDTCMNGRPTGTLGKKTPDGSMWLDDRGRPIYARKIVWRMKPSEPEKLNVALNKKAWRHPNDMAGYYAKLATDGKTAYDLPSMSCTQSSPGTDPWFLIDLERKNQITEVRVLNTDSNPGNLHDFQVHIGSVFSQGNFASNGYTLCGQKTGPGGPGEWVSVTCTSVTLGQFVAVQIPGSSESLTFCEIAVYTTLVTTSLNGSCEWNAQCTTQYSECRPPFNDTTENLQCRCKKFYQDLNGKCVPTADVRPLLTNITVAGTDGMVRGHEVQLTLTVGINNFDGAVFSAASSGANYQASFFASNVNASINGSEAALNDPRISIKSAQEPDLSFGMGIFEMKNVTFKLDVNISPDTCLDVNYLCINLSTPKSASFIPVNTKNDISCFDIRTTLVCQPDIDITLSTINYQGTEIARSRPGNYTFQLTVAHTGATIYDVVTLETGKKNFHTLYFFANEDWTSKNKNLSNAHLLGVSMKMSDAASSIKSGANRILSANITQGMNYTDCHNITHLCFVVYSSQKASFVDSKVGNNLKCFLLSTKKDCAPDVDVNLVNASLTSHSQSIRGYSDPHQFKIIIENVDTHVNVEPVPAGSSNFNVSVYVSSNSSSSRKRRATGSTEGPFSASVNEDTKVGLVTKSNMTLTGSVNIVLSRENCLTMRAICYVVASGTGASYQVKGGQAVLCSDVTSFKNCDGLAIQNSSLSQTGNVLLQGNSMSYTISWDIGTDISFRLYYSKETIASWNWKAANHTQSYKALTVTITHTFKHFYGNFSVLLNISNQVGQQLLNITTMVEPDLNNILTMNSSYIPKATPNNFSIWLPCSNISKLDAPVIVWCSFNFDDDNSTSSVIPDAFGTVTSQALSFNHTYKTDKPDSKPSATCWNHVSRINYTTTVILREPIRGINCTTEAVFWPSLKALSLNITISTGSHAKFNITFGDGTTNSYTHPNRLSTLQPLKIQKTYSIPGTYKINLTTFNEHYNDTYLSPYNITIQNPVGDLDFKGNVLVAYPSGENTYTIVNTNAVRFPTEVHSRFELNNTNLTAEFCPNISKGLSHKTSLSFNRSYIGHNLTFRIISHNLVSTQIYQSYAYFVERIDNLKVKSSLRAAAPGENITFSISVSNGSNVNFEVNYGDGQILSFNHSELLANSKDIVLKKNYSNIGNYTIQVKATNLLNTQTYTVPHHIVIQNAIKTISLSANTSVLYTPAEVDFFLKFDAAQLPLTNIHCTWTYAGKQLQQLYFPSLLAGHAFYQKRAFERSFIGNMSTVVNCSNLVSHSITNFTTEIILDAVILDSLVSNGSVFLTNTSGYVLNIKRFGSRACFQWDLGDGKAKVMYGLPLCKSFADARGIPFTSVEDQQLTIAHEHIYDAIGYYTLTVFAFNHVSNDTLTTVGRVVEWYCFRPNISFPDNITDKVNPPVYMRSQNISIPPILEVDCMKTEDIDYTWTAYNTNDPKAKPVFTQYQTSIFKTGPRALPYGVHFVNLTIQMREIEDTNQTGGFYFKIIKTPLIVAIKGNGTQTLTVNSDYTLNAADVTFDPDVEPSDKTGLLFTWSCKRINSSFDLSEVIRDELGSEALAVISKPEGCFGADPGVLPQKEGAFKVNTAFLLPHSVYGITVNVNKDDRSGKAEQVMVILPVGAPTVKVRCRENNCEARTGVANPLILTVDCFALCGTKFGGLRFFWTLSYSNGNGSTTYDLKGKTLDGFQKRTLRMLPNKMEPGKNHTATVTTWSPGSSKTQVTYKFLTNQPVSGGNCVVTPTQGKASITEFVIRCFDWKEWQPLQKNAPLKYAYFTKQPSSTREFPFAYGIGMNVTEPTVFPVGDFKKVFTLDVVIYIYDSVNDPFRFSMPCQVWPRPEPAEQVMDAVVSQTSGADNPVTKLMSNGSYQQAASMAHSLTSELNVPTALYGGNITNSSSMEAITAVKRTARKNIMTLALELPVLAPEQLLQNNEITKNVMAFRTELDIETLEMGSGRLDNLTNNFRNFKKKGQVDNPELMADDLVGTTATCMGAADYLLQASIAQANQNDTNSTTTVAPIEITTASPSDTADIAKKAQKVMRSAVNVLNEIGDTLVEGKEPGDPDSVILKTEVSLSAATLSPDQMKKQTQVTSPQGTVVMPPIGELFGNDTPACIDRKIFAVAKNPFIYGVQTNQTIESSVISMKFTTCENKLPTARKKRAASAPVDIQPSSPVSVSLKNYNIPKPVFITTPTQTGIVHHSLNITNPPLTVQVSARPLQPEQIRVYLDIGQKPTATSHRWNYSLPKMDNNSVGRNFTITDNVYSITLPGKLIKEALSGLSSQTSNDTTTQSSTLGQTTESPANISDSGNQSNANTIFVGVKREGCIPTLTCKDNGNFSYWFRITQIKIQEFDPVTEKWKDTNSEIQEDSQPDRLNFKSNLFGNLGAGLFSGPNKIDFSTVFNNIGAKLVENMPVVATVIGVILLYAIGLVICHKLDKMDAWKWAALPLIGNLPSAPYDYEIVVYTGKQRHAATDSKVHFILAGTNSDTGIRQLNDGSRKNFKKGDINSFHLKASADLGELMTMSIWHDSSGEGDQAGWFLEKVVVVDKQRGLWTVFHCKKWLDENLGDGSTRRILRVSTHDLMDGSVLFRQNLNRKLFDDHLWLSLAGRQTGSNFSRSQRLSVCLALLYLTMITNAMFYRGADETTTTQGGVITLGPISISVNELVNSIKASLIVVPPILFITIFFTKSCPTRNRIRVDNDKNVTDVFNNYYAKNRMSAASTETEQHQISVSSKLYRLEKKRFPLPWWFVILGWILVFLAVAASAFFTILYSFQWGGVKSRAWLIAFFLSFFESVIIIQPFKVLLITVIITFLFRKDTDVTEFEDSYGQPQNWFDVYSKPESLNLPELEDMEVVDDAKHKKTMSAKASTMMREVIVQSIFLCLLMVVIYSNQDSKVYTQHRDMMNMLKGYKQVNSKGSFVKWMEDGVLPGLYYTSDYRGTPVSKYDQKFIASTYAMRLGPPKLRQLRVKMEECRIPLKARAATKLCGNWYKMNSKWNDQTAYTIGWNASRKSVPDKLTKLEKAFTFQTSSTLRSIPLWGFLATYEGGGYIANLGQDLSVARSMMKDLTKHFWVDRYTRIVLLEYNVLNIQSGLFTQVILMTEFPPVGGAYHWLDLTSVQLYRYAGAYGAINIVTELACVLACIVFAVFTIRDLVNKKCAFFKEIQCIVQLLVLIFFTVAASFYAYRSVWTVRQVEYMMRHWGETVNFQRVAIADRTFMMFLGLTTFIVILQFLGILRYNHTIAMLNTTLAASATEMASMGIIVAIVLAAFVSYANVAFGSKMLEYSTLRTTITALTAAFLGKFDFDDISNTAGFGGQLFLLIYLLTMIFIFVNMFITLLCNFMDAVRNDTSVIPKDHEVVDYMLDSVKALIVPEENQDDIAEIKRNEDSPPPYHHSTDKRKESVIYASDQQ